jgi:hypothetical protein
MEEWNKLLLLLKIGIFLPWTSQNKFKVSFEKEGLPYSGLYNFRRSRSGVMWKVSHIRRRVVIVTGRPASICCQCRAEKPKPIMSS